MPAYCSTFILLCGNFDKIGLVILGWCITSCVGCWGVVGLDILCSLAANYVLHLSTVETFVVTIACEMDVVLCVRPKLKLLYGLRAQSCMKRARGVSADYYMTTQQQITLILHNLA
jgi:hypothetical protein